ncbi:MAG: NAD(P)-dependent oxidoreductase [Caldilineaceae bacterium]|nr:NAD(P)-dependent oxidoreductase [Caldilineaceae bacterium]
MKRILLTGATGRIGAEFFEEMKGRYWFRLAARRPEKLGDVGEHELFHLDVADADRCQEACRDIDAVVHLAADPSPAAGFYESLLDSNIKGAYNIFRAAKDQGCNRVVYASSIQTIEGYPLDRLAFPDGPIRPLNMYGACKAFGEATAHYFAAVEGLSCLCVRIGNYQGNSDSMEADGRRLSAWISNRDMNHLFERCIETPDLQYAILQAVSDNRFKRMDITSARELVGYQPKDDSFQFFATGIQYKDRWYEEAPRQRP